MDERKAIQLIRNAMDTYLMVRPCDRVMYNGPTAEQVDQVELYRKKRERYVRASSIGRCPLRAAKERRGEEPVVQTQDTLSMRWRMEQGAALARVVQSALLHTYKDAVHLEEYLSLGSPHYVDGSPDAYLVFPDDPTTAVLVEIKHREGGTRNRPEPRPTDMYQMLAYRLMLLSMYERVVPILCILYTPTFVEQSNPHAGLRLFALRQGRRGWYLEYEDDPYNTRDLTVTEERFQTMLDMARLYHEKRRLPSPITLESTEAYQCRRVIRTPTRMLAGYAQATCPYWCHDIELDARNGYTFEMEGV